MSMEPIHLLAIKDFIQLMYVFVMLLVNQWADQFYLPNRCQY